MNALAHRIPNHDVSLLAGACNDGPTPGPDHYAEALDNLVADTDRLSTFCMDEQPDYTTVIQLYHAHGLPKRDGSEKDDALWDKYEAAFDGLLTHYRDWLDDTLTNEAYRVMEAEAERAREDAAADAAEMRSMGY